MPTTMCTRLSATQCGALPPRPFDVYGAMDTAAPAILAAESIAQGTQLVRVPDFRPSSERPAGNAP